MGMYNIIITDKKCPKCSAAIDEWQSKSLTYDGYVLANVLNNILLTEHIDGEMHASCGECGAYMEVTIEKGKEVAVKPR